jgi:hypothetical protein
MPWNGDARDEAAGAGSATSLTHGATGDGVAAMQIDPEDSLLSLRRAVARHFRSIWQAALFWTGTLLLAGCVGTTLTPASQPAAPWPEPGHEVVYDFVTPLTKLFFVTLDTQTTPGDECCRFGKMYVRRAS